MSRRLHTAASVTLLSQAELERFFLFFLDDADRLLVERRRGDANRLGFGVQLGTVRFLGTFLADPVDVPTEAVDYVSAQLQVTDPPCLKAYAKREKTRLEHQWEIARVYGTVFLTDASGNTGAAATASAAKDTSLLWSRRSPLLLTPSTWPTRVW